MSVLHSPDPHSPSSLLATPAVAIAILLIGLLMTAFSIAAGLTPFFCMPGGGLAGVGIAGLYRCHRDRQGRQ